MKTLFRSKNLFVAIVLAISCMTAVSIAAINLNDSTALSGVTAGKALFDINIANSGQPADEQKLLLYLDVIKQTHDGLVAQNVSPDFVIAFRGSAVTFLVNNKASDALKAKIDELSKLSKVRIEVCSIATNLTGVDNSTILPQATVVGNTFISAIGFGSTVKGYATIPIM